MGESFEGTGEADRQTDGKGPESEALRARVRAIHVQKGKSLTDIAREAEVSYGTFTNWFGGTYGGRNDRVEAKVEAWLDARERQLQVLAVAPAAPTFQATQTSEEIAVLFSHAQALGSLVVMTGAPGIGKTETIREYARRTPNVSVITVEPGYANAHAVMEELSHALDLPERRSSLVMSRAIQGRLRGVRALIIVDEANHLTTEALDQLRTIRDKAGCGVALVGNETIYARLEGGRKAEFAQLFSRVGMRLKRPGSRVADVDTLLDAWGVEDGPARKVLHLIAKKPGALRVMSDTLRLAHMLAAAEGAPLSAGLLRDAYARLSDTPVAEAA